MISSSQCSCRFTLGFLAVVPGHTPHTAGPQGQSCRGKTDCLFRRCREHATGRIQTCSGHPRTRCSASARPTLLRSPPTRHSPSTPAEATRATHFPSIATSGRMGRGDLSGGQCAARAGGALARRGTMRPQGSGSLTLAAPHGRAARLRGPRTTTGRPSSTASAAMRALDAETRIRAL